MYGLVSLEMGEMRSFFSYKTDKMYLISVINNFIQLSTRTGEWYNLGTCEN